MKENHDRNSDMEALSLWLGTFGKIFTTSIGFVGHFGGISRLKLKS